MYKPHQLQTASYRISLLFSDFCLLSPVPCFFLRIRPLRRRLLRLLEITCCLPFLLGLANPNICLFSTPCLPFNDFSPFLPFFFVLFCCPWLGSGSISVCALTGLPDLLGQLVVLTTLDLSGCDALTGLPESLGQLATLRLQDLTACGALTGLPESLGQLAALTTLHPKWCCALTRLPNALNQLAALTTLDLGNCRASIELPESLGQLVARRR
jgi:hypothetical protein